MMAAYRTSIERVGQHPGKALGIAICFLALLVAVSWRPALDLSLVGLLSNSSPSSTAAQKLHKAYDGQFSRLTVHFDQDTPEERRAAEEAAIPVLESMPGVRQVVPLSTSSSTQSLAVVPDFPTTDASSSEALYRAINRLETLAPAPVLKGTLVDQQIEKLEFRESAFKALMLGFASLFLVLLLLFRSPWTALQTMLPAFIVAFGTAAFGRAAFSSLNLLTVWLPALLGLWTLTASTLAVIKYRHLQQHPGFQAQRAWMQVTVSVGRSNLFAALSVAALVAPLAFADVQGALQASLLSGLGIVLGILSLGWALPAALFSAPNLTHPSLATSLAHRATKRTANQSPRTRSARLRLVLVATAFIGLLAVSVCVLGVNLIQMNTAQPLPFGFGTATETAPAVVFIETADHQARVLEALKGKRDIGQVWTSDHPNPAHTSTANRLAFSRIDWETAGVVRIDPPHALITIDDHLAFASAVSDLPGSSGGSIDGIGPGQPLREIRNRVAEKARYLIGAALLGLLLVALFAFRLSWGAARLMLVLSTAVLAASSILALVGVSFGPMSWLMFAIWIGFGLQGCYLTLLPQVVPEDEPEPYIFVTTGLAVSGILASIVGATLFAFESMRPLGPLILAGLAVIGFVMAAAVVHIGARVRLFRR